jgi:hypothetical protein
MGGALTVEGASLLNQDLTTDASPTLAGLTLATGHLIYGNANFDIKANTADGPDTLAVSLVGGGARGAGRGSQLTATGNDYGYGYSGMVEIYAGAPGAPAGFDGMILFGPNFTLRWLMDRSGALIAQAGASFVGEYQTQSGAWAAPAGGTNGRIVTLYNSTQAATRLYVYSNGAWTYVLMT